MRACARSLGVARRSLRDHIKCHFQNVCVSHWLYRPSWGLSVCVLQRTAPLAYNTQSGLSPRELPFRSIDLGEVALRVPARPRYERICTHLKPFSITGGTTVIEKGFNQAGRGPASPHLRRALCVWRYLMKAFTLLDMHGKQELFSSALPQFYNHMVQISK